MTAEGILLSTGEFIASKFIMLMPPFTGVDFIRNSPKLNPQADGFLDVQEPTSTMNIKMCGGAGLTVDVPAPFSCRKVPYAVPKTGYPSDRPVRSWQKISYA